MTLQIISLLLVKTSWTFGYENSSLLAREFDEIYPKQPRLQRGAREVHPDACFGHGTAVA